MILALLCSIWQIQSLMQDREAEVCGLDQRPNAWLALCDGMMLLLTSGCSGAMHDDIIWSVIIIISARLGLACTNT